MADHTTEHLIACLEAWRVLGGDRRADEIEAELVDRGVPYSDWREEEEVPA